MTLSFIRSFFVIVSGVVGYYVGTLIEIQNHIAGLEVATMGAMVGCLGALILILLEMQLRSVSVRGLSSVVFGLLLGLFMAKLMSSILGLLPLDPFVVSISEIVLILIFSYLGAVMAMRGKDEFSLIIPYVRFRRQDTREEDILLDTSAIIDGRIYDIYRSRFLNGRLVVPKFVLSELQQLGDSQNDIKRERGRRGMEMLRHMQEDPKVDIRIQDNDVLDGLGADEMLVRTAKMMDARVCTTDFNLDRVAVLQGVETLNINALASAVKAVVLNGEVLTIRLIKEGKESDQAIGFLEDGTMVVVGQARSLIGQVVSVAVTSFLQTQSGKMVFAKIVK